MKTTITLVLPALWACSGKSDDTAPADDTGAYVDQDKDDDGSPKNKDCNDNDPTVKPGADEICDGQDNDCDDEVDEDPVDGEEHWPDNDGDGWGNSSQASVIACEPPPGYAAQDEDCNDDDPAIHPETVWYEDLDGDGYGTKKVAQQCNDPFQAATNDGDCEDDDPEINPGATEVCDGLDNDCDGDWDNNAVDADRYYQDKDGDGYGDPTTAVEACWLPSGYQDLGYDCDDSDDSINPEATEVCGDKIDSDCSGRVDNGCVTHNVSSASQTYNGESTYSDFGISVAFIGDWDGDGKDEWAAGAPRNDDNGNDVGKLYIFDGTSSTGSWAADTAAAAVIEGSAQRTGVGNHVAGGGDITGDGVPDLLIGGYGPDYYSGCYYCGEAWVFAGPVSGDLQETSADITIPWITDTYAYFGSSGDFADVNGDGNLDLVVGGEDVSATGSYSSDGAIFAFFGPLSSGSYEPLKQADVSFVGDSNARAGSSAFADFTGDGTTDMVVGGWGAESNKGRVWMMEGPTSGDYDSSFADVEIGGVLEDEWFGTRVAHAGDLNGDGHADLLISAERDDYAITRGGTVFVEYGPITDSHNALEINDLLAGEDSNGSFGVGLAEGIRDWDGDGNDDVLVGGYRGDEGANGAGGGYLFYGPVSGPRFMDGADIKLSATVNAEMGYQLSWEGDADGDSMPDVLIGGRNASSIGRTWVFSGADL